MCSCGMQVTHTNILIWKYVNKHDVNHKYENIHKWEFDLSRPVRGKNGYLKVSVLQGYVTTSFEFQVLWEWTPDEIKLER